MANGMNIQVVAGRVKGVNKRIVRDKALTVIQVEGFDFSILVWEAEVSAQEGDYILAEGRVQSRSYEKDGKTQYVTEIIAHRVVNLSEGKAGNIAFAVGNLGKAPQMKYTPDGKAVTNVSLAAGAFGVEKPEWLNLVAWTQVAEVMNQHLDKGSRIAVAGRLVRETWQGKGEHEGKSFHRTKLVVNDLLMLGG
ncbi:MAG: single-stranded DNA-binding protein, partial [Anaerolineae bacterium]|nr:single-stranded DNA-binding protein [Anaerolineae bacterium]